MKLGFTFYPKDWWTSDTFFELTSSQRYIFLECFFLMYANSGYIRREKELLETRLRVCISDEDWEAVTSKFIVDNEKFTLLSVNKRLKKANTSRENGQKGGRPLKQINDPVEREPQTSLDHKALTELKQLIKSTPNFEYDTYIQNLENDILNSESESDIEQLNFLIQYLQKEDYKSKNKIPIPSWDEYWAYQSNYITEKLKENADSYHISSESKYTAWIDNNWKDGNNNPIKDWKAKARNIIKYLTKSSLNGTDRKFAGRQSEQTAAESYNAFKQASERRRNQVSGDSN